MFPGHISLFAKTIGQQLGLSHQGAYMVNIDHVVHCIRNARDSKAMKITTQHYFQKQGSLPVVEAHCRPAESMTSLLLLLAGLSMCIVRSTHRLGVTCVSATLH